LKVIYISLIIFTTAKIIAIMDYIQIIEYAKIAKIKDVEYVLQKEYVIIARRTSNYLMEYVSINVLKVLLRLSNKLMA
jgi:hypothetical protein